jgi:hypothetical protein
MTVLTRPVQPGRDASAEPRPVPLTVLTPPVFDTRALSYAAWTLTAPPRGPFVSHICCRSWVREPPR